MLCIPSFSVHHFPGSRSRGIPQDWHRTCFMASNIQRRLFIVEKVKSRCDSLYRFSYPCNYLSEFCAIWYRTFWDRENHRSIFTVESGTEEFTDERSDPLRWEIHHTDYLLPEEFFFAVVDSDLSTWLLRADLSSEIHPELVGTFASFREIFHTDDCSHTELDGFEVWPRNCIHEGEYREYPPMCNIAREKK